jgi:glyoxylase-like metal-dependent hydrolase (beta-lactamase superfamily II)
MKLRDSLHRIGNDIVAVYLVDSPDGVLVIDAGLPGHFAELLAELEIMGRTVADVKGVVLTHGDSDHVGFAERIRRDHGVPVFVHTADAARAKGAKPPATATPKMKLGPLLGFVGYSLRKNGLKTTHLTEVVEVTDGDVLDLPGAPQIIGMPGHSPGSIAVFVPSVDAIFVGDALTTRHVLTGVEGPAPAPFTDELEVAIASLTKLLPTDATWVLPGHGAPWGGGVAAAVEAVRNS